MSEPFNITPIVTHVEDGLADLRMRDRNGKPDVDAQRYIEPFLREIQILEDLMYTVLRQTQIETAEAGWLDRLGRLIGQARFGLPDVDYRRVIEARALANQSAGHVDDIVAITRLVTGATSVQWIHKPPTTQVVQYCVSTPLSDELRRALKDILSGLSGSGTIRIYECTLGNNLGFEDAPGATGFDRGAFSRLL